MQTVKPAGASTRAISARLLPPPIAERYPDEAASIKRLAIGMLRARKHGGEDFETARELYRLAVVNLSGKLPDLEPWQVERMVLPDDLKNPNVCFAGLPESRLPFSLLGGWVNERLEAALDKEFPPNGRRSTYIRLISRILDRYVESSFPLESMPDFYRPAVLRLQAISFQPGLYEGTVINCAISLAESALLSLLTENTNLLKMSSHKSISIETGVTLSENHSSSHKDQARKAGSDYGNRFIGPSISGGKGLTLHTPNLHPIHGARLGLPHFERITAAKKTPVYATKDELLSHLQYVIRSGKTSRRSHPDLAGMEFPIEVCDAAVEVAIAAEKKAAGDDSSLDALWPEALHAALFISAMHPFRDVCESADRRAQLRIALEAYSIEIRAKYLIGRFSLDDAGDQAVKDIEMARNFVEEYRNPPQNESMVLRSVRRMRQLAKEVECIDLTDYELALRVVDERHMKREPLSTMRPPSGSLPPASAEPEIPRPCQLPADLQAPPAAPAEACEPEPLTEIGVDIDLDSLGGEPFEEAPVEPEGAGDETTEPVLVAPVQDDSHAPDEPHAAAAEPESVFDVPPPETLEAQEQAAEAGHAVPVEPAVTVTRAEAPPQAQAAPAAQSAAVAPAEQVPGYALPEFEFPQYSNTILDAALEPLLPPKDCPRNVLIRRVARTLVFYKLSDYVDDSIDSRCVGAVACLRANYSAQAAFDFAIAIVDGVPVLAPAPTPAPAQAAAMSASVMLGQMGKSEMELVAGVMGVPACDEGVLSGFLGMKPAFRELLMQRFIARRWIDGDFRTDINRFRSAKKTIYSTCGLSVPTPEEKRALVSDPGVLSSEQIFFVKHLFYTSEPLTPKHMEALAVWASNDPATDEGRARLGEYWNNVILTAPPNAFNLNSGTWLNAPYADRMRLWHSASSDILSAGSLAHKLRFNSGERLSYDEASLVSQLYNKRWDEVWGLGEHSKQNLAMALTLHTYKKGREDRKHEVAEYFPEIVSLSRLPYAYRVQLADKPGGVNPLHYAAMREMEFNTMLEFLGVPIQGASGALILTNGKSKANTLVKKPKPNEDCWSCARVTLPDGSVIGIDMVADGMGGQDKGANGGKSNGEVASGIARDVFEVAAVAGWIREPEDARKVMLIADMAVALEQIRKKAFGLAVEEVTRAWKDSGVDVPNMNPEWMGEYSAQVEASFVRHLSSMDSEQENQMGTTMTIALQRGKHLWFIHCGDSDGKLVRDGRIVFNTVGHSAEYEMRLDARIKTREELVDAYGNRGIDVATLDAEGSEKFERELDALYEANIERMKPVFAQYGHVVSSGLGVGPKHLHINNAELGAAPLEVGENDVIWVSSDGITVPVCDHEIPIVIFGKCMGDLEAARDMFISLAEARKSSKPQNPTMCECRERPGKDDDKTLTLRYAGEGMGAESLSGPGGKHAAPAGKYAWLSRQIAMNPKGLALSKSMRLVVDGCADPQLPQDELMRVFGVFIDTAESTPPQTSTDAYSLAVSSIFSAVSRRPDRDELIDALVPRLGSWSGLILKKLRNSPDASERKRAMFDFVAASVPAEALESLLQARNSYICAWSQEALGIETPVDGKQVTFASSDAPQPIFDSQTDEDGGPLDIWSTRYLDTKVVDIFGSTVVADTAKKLAVLPRDLEIMAFYVYSDFEPHVTMDTHLSAAGQHLIASVSDHLCTGDAERILAASFLLYCLKEGNPEPHEAKRMARELWKTMTEMDVDAPYSLMFHNKAFAYKNLMK